MGEIKVTVQTEKRLEAINNLAIAVKKIAEALASGTKVVIKDNIFNSGNPAVNIDSAEKIFETKIEGIK